MNAVLELEEPAQIQNLSILNPYSERDFKNDKLSIVDVKVQDLEGRTIQVEVQVVSYSALKERILFNWSQIYSKDIKGGAP